MTRTCAAKAEATVKAVCRSDQRAEPKTDVGQGELRAGWGLVGDSHAGPPRPGRWQVSLLAWEDVDSLNQEFGLDAVPGSFAENLTTEGLEPSSLRVGDRIVIGGAVLEVEQLGKPPEIAHTFSYQGHTLLPTKGIFCGILVSGVVATGSPLVVQPREQ